MYIPIWTYRNGMSYCPFVLKEPRPKQNILKLYSFYIDQMKKIVGKDDSPVGP